MTKKLVLIAFVSVLSFAAHAQLNHPTNNITDSTIFESVDVMPKYPDGVIALDKFINLNLRHTGDKGLVYVAFTVEKDGSLSHIHAAKGVSKDAADEAVRVMSLSKKWIPGLQNGKPVRVGYVLRG